MDSDSADSALLRSISLDTVGARNRQYTGRVLPAGGETISCHVGEAWQLFANCGLAIA